MRIYSSPDLPLLRRSSLDAISTPYHRQSRHFSGKGVVSDVVGRRPTTFTLGLDSSSPSLVMSPRDPSPPDASGGGKRRHRSRQRRNSAFRSRRVAIETLGLLGRLRSRSIIASLSTSQNFSRLLNHPCRYMHICTTIYCIYALENLMYASNRGINRQV